MRLDDCVEPCLPSLSSLVTSFSHEILHASVSALIENIPAILAWCPPQSDGCVFWDGADFVKMTFRPFPWPKVIFRSSFVLQDISGRGWDVPWSFLGLVALGWRDPESV